MNTYLASFEAWLNQAGYAGVFLANLTGNIGLPALGSAGLVLMLRYLVSPQWWIAAAVAAAGETTGQFFQYSVARFGAESVIGRMQKRAGANQPNANRFEQFYRKYGSAAVFLCRFIPGVKSFSSFPAGAARMPIVPFLGYTVLGALLSTLAVAWAVHVVGERSPMFAGHARQHGPLLLLLLMVGVAVIAVLRRTLRRKRRHD